MPVDSSLPEGKSRSILRRWLVPRYSLRTLLLMMTAACLFSGYWLNSAIHQRNAVRRFYELTAQRPASLQGDHVTTMGYRYQGRDDYYEPIIPWWAQPLKMVLGEEAFGEITGVQLLGSPATDEDLRFLASMPELERINLSGTKITDAGLIHLQNCPRLTFVSLEDTAVTDQGLAQLLALQELEGLSLSGTKITDAGLDELAKLPNLSELWLRKTEITNQGYRKLQAALPQCEIQGDPPAVPWTGGGGGGFGGASR
jgi:Leucine-rich repeat (LRR) protein